MVRLYKDMYVASWNPEEKNKAAGERGPWECDVFYPIVLQAVASMEVTCRCSTQWFAIYKRHLAIWIDQSRYFQNCIQDIQQTKVVPGTWDNSPQPVLWCSEQCPEKGNCWLLTADKPGHVVTGFDQSVFPEEIYPTTELDYLVTEDLQFPYHCLAQNFVNDLPSSESFCTFLNNIKPWI